MQKQTPGVINNHGISEYDVYPHRGSRTAIRICFCDKNYVRTQLISIFHPEISKYRVSIKPVCT